MATHPTQNMPGPVVSHYDGLYFDGIVMISDDDQLVIQIPAVDWAAIVAELSWAGRTPDRHERALRFHGEELEETGDGDG